MPKKKQYGLVLIQEVLAKSFPKIVAYVFEKCRPKGMICYLDGVCIS